MSLVHRLKYALTLVTIEPMVLVQGVADYIAEVPEAQMVLYKTCRGKQCGQMNKQWSIYIVLSHKISDVSLLRGSV